jgi:type IV fimbrial biogenesis protein FimT
MQDVTQRGWSLVELLTVLAVSAILITVAVPSLGSVFYELQVRSAAHEFAAWMTQARSEAIKRRQGRVVVCATSSGTTCTASGGWLNGWLLFHDVNGNAQLDGEELIMRHQNGFSQQLLIRGNSHVAHYVSYAPSGQTLLVSGAIQVGTFSFCHEKGTQGWQVVLSATGRIRIAKWSPAAGCE